jgi:hypothetical protein
MLMFFYSFQLILSLSKKPPIFPPSCVCLSVILNISLYSLSVYSRQGWKSHSRPSKFLPNSWRHSSSGLRDLTRPFFQSTEKFLKWLLSYIFSVFSDACTFVQNFRSGIDSFLNAGMPVLCLLYHFLLVQRNVSLPHLMFMHICKYVFSPHALHGSLLVCIHRVIDSWNHMLYLFKLNSWWPHMYQIKKGVSQNQCIFSQTLQCDWEGVIAVLLSYSFSFHRLFFGVS